MLMLLLIVTASHAPPPAPVQNGGGSMLGGLGATIAQGRQKLQIVQNLNALHTCCHCIQLFFCYTDFGLMIAFRLTS